MADTMEAVWQSVQQKAADELIGIECHDLGDAALSVVFPGEAHLPVGEREEPTVGDGDAMGIAAEIGQHLFGPAEWWLGVDHPIEAPKVAETTCEGLRFGKVAELAEESQPAGAKAFSIPARTVGGTAARARVPAGRSGKEESRKKGGWE